MKGASFIMTVNQKEVEVSIIIPAHNAEPFITRCLQSIQCQTFKDFRVLIVENASTDHTVDKVLAFVSKDKRFTLLRSPISGVSNARNLGLREAHSEFVTFIDADDFVTKNHLQVLIDHITSAETDMVVTGFSYETEKGKVIKAISALNSKLSSEDAIRSSYDFNGIQGVVWNKIFRKSIIDKHNIQFDASIPKYEDHKFVVTYLIHCHQVSCENVITYHYIKHPTSSLLTVQTSLIQDLDVYLAMRKMIINQGFRDIKEYVDIPLQIIVLNHYWHPVDSKDKMDAAQRMISKRFIVRNLFRTSPKIKLKFLFALISLIFFWTKWELIRIVKREDGDKISR